MGLACLRFYLNMMPPRFDGGRILMCPAAAQCAEQGSATLLSTEYTSELRGAWSRSDRSAVSADANHLLIWRRPQA